MTLDELVSHVGTSTGYSETDDQAACRKFLLARDRYIYESALWKDSLVMAPITVDPSTNEDHAAGIVLLPEVIGRPVAVRSTINSIRIRPLEYYHRIDFDRFSAQGNPYEFAILSPIWFTIRPDSSPLVADHAADLVPQEPTYEDEWPVVDPGVGVTSALAVKFPVTPGVQYELVADSNTLGLLNTADLTPSLADEITLSAGQTYRFTALGSYILIIGSVAAFTFLGTVAPLALSPFKSSGAGATVVIDGGADTSAIKVIWRDLAGKRYTTSGAMPLTLTPDDDAGYFEIEAIFKPTTTEAVTVTLNDGATGLSLVEGTLATTATRSPSHQRLRLFGIPAQAVAINVLGKAPYQSLDFASQEPMLRNSENCLIAFARGDLLRRGGENGNAQLAYQEGAALLQQLKDVEAVQAANNQRIIPEDGFGPEWGIGPSGGMVSF